MTSFERIYPRTNAAVSGDGRPPKHVATPLASPVRGSKNTPVYNTHSYPTKVPPEAIEPFLRHHTRPNDLVLDPFCGSGMTGVTARRLGRRAVLNDVSFGATHIAHNLVTPCDPAHLKAAADAVLAAVNAEFRDWFTTTGRDRKPAEVEWVLHSEVVSCPHCRARNSVWDDAADQEKGTVPDQWHCRACQKLINKRGASIVGSRPALVVFRDRDGRARRAPSRGDITRLRRIAEEPCHDWYPRVPLSANREMYIRSALHLRGISEVADFYTARNLRALAALWREISAYPDQRIRQVLALAFTNTAWHATRMRRYNARGGQRPLTGTLYIPQLSIEVNPARVFAHKIDQLCRYYAVEKSQADEVVVFRGSAIELPINDASIDYCFTDPPFGSNIFYADCAVVWESWLGHVTPTSEEAVVNRSLKPQAGGKTLGDYAALIEAAFDEIARVLKADAWTTVVFNTSDAETWSAFRVAVERAGFDLASASYLDKTQQSHKGYKGRSGSEDVPAFDVVLNLHKPGQIRRRPAPPGGYREAGELLAAHLASLPTVGSDPEKDRQRTLPFMHSLLVQAHFNGTIGLEVGEYALVRRICAERFVCDENGRWHLCRRDSVRPMSANATSP
jgi:DNA modification methylase